MSILTHKMKTARSDYYGANCQIWLPANHGSGNTLTDKIQGAVMTATGSANHDTPHGISLTQAASAAATFSGSPKLGKYGLALYVSKVGAGGGSLCQFNFGRSDGSNTGILLAGSTTLRSTTLVANGTGSGTAAASDFQISAAAWDLTNLYTYQGFNTASASAVATLVDTDALPGGMSASFPRDITAQLFINPAIASVIYGAALFSFTGGLPTDLLTQINWMAQRWFAGDKVLPASWKGLD